MAAYEVITYVLSKSHLKLSKLSAAKIHAYVRSLPGKLWKNPNFIKYSGAGVRGTSRIANFDLISKPLIFK